MKSCSNNTSTATPAGARGKENKAVSPRPGLPLVPTRHTFVDPAFVVPPIPPWPWPPVPLREGFPPYHPLSLADTETPQQHQAYNAPAAPFRCGQTFAGTLPWQQLPMGLPPPQWAQKEPLLNHQDYSTAKVPLRSVLSPGPTFAGQLSPIPKTKEVQLESNSTVTEALIDGSKIYSEHDNVFLDNLC